MPKHFGLLGNNLTHTMSPSIHSALLSSIGIDGDYNVFDIPETEFKKRLPKIFSLDGFNVTIPYKTRIIPFLDELDDTAKRLGSVNVVHRIGNRLIGSNTDCIGFTKSLEMSDIPLSGDVAIIGIGGVGRMFAIESALNGCNVTLLIRQGQQERAKLLCDELKKYNVQTNIVPLEAVSKTYDILINATPVGMFPHINECPIEKKFIRYFKYVFDCIYNPAETVLLNFCKNQGVQALGGFPMLVLQAIAAQEIWNNITFESHIAKSLIQKLR